MTLRRWVRNQIYWKRNEIRAIFWHLSTYFRQPQAYRICHFYDWPTTRPAFVGGRGNPENILAYLQFLAEDHFCDDSDWEIDHEAVAQLLARHYGYTTLPHHRGWAEPVDMYSIREDRCGKTLHQWIARCLYYRRGLLADLLKNCVQR